MIRLADVDRIESIWSEGLSKSGELSSPSAREGPSLIWDARASWFSFIYEVERGIKAPDNTFSIPDAPLSKDEQSVVIRPTTGIAQIIPVRPNTKVFFECRCSLNVSMLNTAVYELCFYFDFPRDNRQGLLRNAITALCRGTHRLNGSKCNDTLKCAISTGAETRALLFMAYSIEDVWSRLDWIRVTPLDARGGEASGMKAKEMPQDTSRISILSIDNVRRPSLLIAPGDRIEFKEVKLPENAVLRCALGQPLGVGDNIKFTLTGKDEINRNHEILTWLTDPSLNGWDSMEKDLGDLSDRRIRFSITCDWVSAEKDRPSAGPPVCFGSPIIYTRKIPNDRSNLNLVLISLDTLRFDHLGCYGYSRPVSPHIDRLADRGFLFRRAYSHSPFTLPSHASLFTSLYPSVHGLESVEAEVLPHGSGLLAEILADNELATASFNGGGFLSYSFGFHWGFDLVCEVDPLGDRFLDGISPFGVHFSDGSQGSMDRMLSWIEGMKDHRFFLFLHTFMIHNYLPPRESVKEIHKGSGEEFEPSREELTRIRNKVKEKQILSQEDLAYLVTLYDGTIRAGDEMVGQVVSHLERLGLMDDTIIVITSDHGEEFKDHGGMYHGKTLYEEMIHVPLIIYMPGERGGRDIAAPVSHVDLLPTLLDIMKIN